MSQWYGTVLHSQRKPAQFHYFSCPGDERELLELHKSPSLRPPPPLSLSVSLPPSPLPSSASLLWAPDHLLSLVCGRFFELVLLDDR